MNENDTIEDLFFNSMIRVIEMFVFATFVVGMYVVGNDLIGQGQLVSIVFIVISVLIYKNKDKKVLDLMGIEKESE